MSSAAIYTQGFAGSASVTEPFAGQPSVPADAIAALQAALDKGPEAAAAAVVLAAAKASNSPESFEQLVQAFLALYKELGQRSRLATHEGMMQQFEAALRAASEAYKAAILGGATSLAFAGVGVVFGGGLVAAKGVSWLKGKMAPDAGNPTAAKGNTADAAKQNSSDMQAKDMKALEKAGQGDAARSQVDKTADSPADRPGDGLDAPGKSDSGNRTERPADSPANSPADSAANQPATHSATNSATDPTGQPAGSQHMTQNETSSIVAGLLMYALPNLGQGASQLASAEPQRASEDFRAVSELVSQWLGSAEKSAGAYDSGYQTVANAYANAN